MKKLILTAICGCIAAFALAQGVPTTFTIKGTIIDSAKNEPMGYVTVTLLDALTGKNEKATFTKDNGSFEFSGLASKTYKLSAAFVGYKSKQLDIDLKATTDAGRILLSPSASQLKEVAVVAAKPLVKQEIDRISYDVQADPESKAMNALDMMRKLPLVSVDGDDNIQLQGSGSYKIFINGKPSPLLANNPKDVLKTMQASTIQKIEVITTPPAKYDSEGLAGIINIITNQKQDDGYNGTIGARYNYPWGPNVNFTGTVKQGKFGFSASGAVGRQTPVDVVSGSMRQTDGAIKSSLLQNGLNSYGGNFYYGTAELSFEADTLNLFTASVNLDHTVFNQDNSRSSLFTNGAGALQSYNMFNDGNFKFANVDASLNYQLSFKRNKLQLLTASYQYSDNDNNQYSNIWLTQKVNYQLNDYNQINKTRQRENTFQLDYVHPFSKLIIEAGAKAILRNNVANYTSGDFDIATQAYPIDPSRSNLFDYKQNVLSAYNSYQLKLTNWTLKGGARLEHTGVNANFTSNGSLLNTSYTNLVPSISVMRSFKNNVAITFGFTNRIERPGIYQLNPFVNRSNPKFIYFGNPDLKPVLSNLFEANFTKSGKGSFNFRAAYSFSNNNIESLTSLVADSISQSSFYNIGLLRLFTLSSSFNYPLTKKWNVNANALVARINLRGAYNGGMLEKTGYRENISLSTTYKFNDGWRMGYNTNYSSPFISLMGRGNYFYWNSVSLTHTFLATKATLTGMVNNPYQRYRQYDNVINGPDFTQRSYNNNYYRTFSLAFTYKFGKLNSEIKKNSRGIKNDDKGSSGN